MAAASTILVVDDDEAVRTTLCQVLQDEGYRAISVGDGEAALECVLNERPSLVFLDIWMPGIDGMEALVQLREIAPTLPVVMISGHATIANALEATKRGAFDFIEKPLDLESIIFVLNRALAHEAAEVPTDSGGLNFFSHPGITSRGNAGRNLGQRTLRKSAVLYGHCLHSGNKSGLVLEPLPPNSGIHFAGMGDTHAVPAFIDYVESTNFATRIRSGKTSAATIEHLMAALHAYGVSNLLLKCNEEVPILDGSAKEFCELIERVGLEEQEGDWFELRVSEPCYWPAPNGQEKLSQNIESIRFEPADSLTVEYHLHYPDPVGSHAFSFTLDSVEAFKREVAPARTFGFMKDIERLQKAGLAAGGRLDNFILIGPDGAVNTSLRFPDELVRHKVLDVIGDIFLLGRPICGKVVASMTGHSDNVKLLSALRDKAFSDV